MYHEFKASVKAQQVQVDFLRKDKRELKVDTKDTNLCIIIPLKGNKKREG